MLHDIRKMKKKKVIEATFESTPLANGTCPKKQKYSKHALQVLLMIVGILFKGAQCPLHINGIYHEDALKQAGSGRRGKPSELLGTHLAT